MLKYAPFLTVVAAAAAPFRHRGRDRDYWNVQEPDQLYGPLRAEPFEALGVACKRTAGRLTRATATRELNRADHLVLGLAPPGTGLLPPGEPDVFATRGEAR